MKNCGFNNLILPIEFYLAIFYFEADSLFRFAACRLRKIQVRYKIYKLLFISMKTDAQNVGRYISTKYETSS